METSTVPQPELSDQELFPRFHDAIAQWWPGADNSSKIRRTTWQTALSRYSDFLDSQKVNGGPASISRETLKQFFESDKYLSYSRSYQKVMVDSLNRLVGIKEGTLELSEHAPPPMPENKVGKVTGEQWYRKKKRKEREAREMVERNGDMFETAPAATPATSVATPSVPIEEITHKPLKGDGGMKDVRQVIGEEDRILISAVHADGKPSPIGWYSPSDFAHTGGEVVAFVNQYLSPQFPNAREFLVSVRDSRGTIVPKKKIPVATRQAESSSVHEAVKIVSNVQREAREEADAQWDREQRRYEQTLDKLKDIVGGSGKEGGSPIVRDAIAMEMARDVMGNMRGRTGSQWDDVLRKLDEIAKRAEEKKEEGRAPTMVEQLMELQTFRRMMDEMQPPLERMEREPPGPWNGPPAVPAPPTKSPAEEFDTMASAMQKIMPQNQTPAQQLTYEGVVNLMGNLQGMFKPQLDPQVQNFINEMGRRMDKLEDRLFNAPPTSPTTQLKELGEAMQIAQRVFGGGSGASEEFWTGLARMTDRLPDIIESYGRVKAAATGFEGLEESVSSGPAPRPTEARKPKPVKTRNDNIKMAWREFHSRVTSATEDSEVIESIVMLAKVLCGKGETESEARWRKLFFTLGIFAIQGEGAKIRGYVNTIMKTVFKGTPPAGAVDRIVRVIMENREDFAHFVGVELEEKTDEQHESISEGAPEEGTEREESEDEGGEEGAEAEIAEGEVLDQNGFPVDEP